jgi:hypothetical protein
MRASKSEPVVKVRIRSNQGVKFSESKTTQLKMGNTLQKQEKYFQIEVKKKENTGKKKENAAKTKENAAKKNKKN